MQQKVCDEIRLSKSPLKEHTFKDDDLRSLQVFSEHFKYFKTPKCNDSLLLSVLSGPDVRKSWEKAFNQN